LLATVLYVPAGIALALAFGLFGVPLEAMLTFDGTFEIYWGLCTWWLVVFGAACTYAARAFPIDRQA
jgi:hypothetical protein